MKPSIRTIILPLLALIALSCFAPCPTAQAVSPPPDGGYPGGNTAEGQNALFSLTSGTFNTGVGLFSLNALSAGTFCTGVGAGTLLSNTADENTATGAGALLSNTAGSLNTANGAFSLFSNTTGDGNTATGMQALFSNTVGEANTATGFQALNLNTAGVQNTANGNQALFANTTGAFNTAIGVQALISNITGDHNTALGEQALFTNTSGDSNTAIGDAAGTFITGNGNVCIGAGVTGVAGESDHTYIRNIDTTAVNGGTSDFVTVDLSTGLLGHLTSSRRYKEDIKLMDKASEVLFALKPVTYHYKKDIDRAQGLDYGLIAEDVAKVDPNLAIRDGKGQIESVRYNAINAMLLNEFLKEHRKVQDLEVTVAQQHKGIELLTAQLKEQAAQIEKVSAQVEMSGPASRVVANKP
jgi:Chaperone of endosialidase